MLFVTVPNLELLDVKLPSFVIVPTFVTPDNVVLPSWALLSVSIDPPVAVTVPLFTVNVPTIVSVNPAVPSWFVKVVIDPPSAVKVPLFVSVVTVVSVNAALPILSSEVIVSSVDIKLLLFVTVPSVELLLAKEPLFSTSLNETLVAFNLAPVATVVFPPTVKGFVVPIKPTSPPITSKTVEIVVSVNVAFPAVFNKAAIVPPFVVKEPLFSTDVNVAFSPLNLPEFIKPFNVLFWTFIDPEFSTKSSASWMRTFFKTRP